MSKVIGIQYTSVVSNMLYNCTDNLTIIYNIYYYKYYIDKHIEVNSNHMKFIKAQDLDIQKPYLKEL